MKFITYCLSVSLITGFITTLFCKRGIITDIFMLNEQNVRNFGKYPISRNYYEESIKRLISNNKTINNIKLLRLYNPELWNQNNKEPLIIIHHIETVTATSNNNDTTIDEDTIEKQHINRRNHTFKKLIERYNNQEKEEKEEKEENKHIDKKSEHFEIIYNNQITFMDIGGLDTIKTEMLQCVDMLKNWKKYSRFSVRTPKGLILEGPPGNGKTMLAKGFAGESGVNFIAVSGAEFQDKYIGVGSSKIRELFKLASKNIPCIIFIDEIDALGRNRNDDNSGGNAERDNTLNQLLVEMDGFRNNTGIFVIGATNRADLLDPALMRPGRIDKRIYVGMPDIIARRFIIDIHIEGKPNTFGKDKITELVSMTSGFSGAQIENLLNEAMLLALKNNKEEFNMLDINIIYNRILGGTQSEEHIITDELLERICVHELGHSIMGLLCKYHPLMKKVVINLNSPINPGMTIFEDDESIKLDTYESLFERISILYGGRIAELLIYGEGLISNGASSDYNEALEIAQKMVIDYGMGKNQYSGIGESSKKKIDIEVEKILKNCYDNTYSILQNKKDCIISGSAILKKNKSITRRDLQAYLML